MRGPVAARLDLHPALAAVSRFVLGSLAAIAVVVVGGFFALRSVTIQEAERNTREQVRVDGSLVEAASLSDGVLAGNPSAICAPQPSGARASSVSQLCG